MFEIPILTLKLLIISIITAKRQLIHNRTAQRNTWNDTYDFIVVGAGGSGCVVASRLSENPKLRVLLLEVGGAQDAIYTDIAGIATNFLSFIRPELHYIYYSEPEDILKIMNRSGRLRLLAGRVIGGSNSVNELGYHRAMIKDLDNWADNYGAHGWSFKDVLPFYIRFENNTDINVLNAHPGLYGTNGPVQIRTPRNVDQILLLTRQAYYELGYNDTYISSVNQTGTIIIQSYIDQNGLRSESGNAYVDPNPHPNNLHIVTRANVLRVLFDNLTAIGVEFDRNDTSYRVYARKEVILSAGPFQTPHILMLSGIGPRNHLQTFGIPVLLDLPVGNNFQYLVYVPFLMNVSRQLINPPRRLTIDNLSQLYFNRSGLLYEVPILLLYSSTSYNLDKEWPNFILGASAYTFSDIYAFENVQGRINSRGQIRLQSNNPYIPPKIYSNVFSVEPDFENQMEIVRFSLYIMERTSLAQYVTPYPFESVGCPACQSRYMYECTDSIRCYILTQLFLQHFGGSCRMGDPRRDDVVVDPTLLVKHAKHLRVCDTSIVPVVFVSGLAADAMMIGEKCSQMIKDCYNL